MAAPATPMTATAAAVLALLGGWGFWPTAVVPPEGASSEHALRILDGALENITADANNSSDSVQSSMAYNVYFAQVLDRIHEKFLLAVEGCSFAVLSVWSPLFAFAVAAVSILSLCVVTGACFYMCLRRRRCSRSVDTTPAGIAHDGEKLADAADVDVVSAPTEAEAAMEVQQAQLDEHSAEKYAEKLPADCASALIDVSAVPTPTRGRHSGAEEAHEEEVMTASDSTEA